MPHTGVTVPALSAAGETPVAAPPSPAARFAQLALVIPRAVAFLLGAGRTPRAGIPRLRPSPPTVAAVVLDDLVSTVQYVLAGSVEGRLDAATLERAASALRAGGFVDRPASFHPRPPAPSAGETTVRMRRTFGLRYEHVTYPSDYRWTIADPDAAWLADDHNRVGHAYVLRHDDRPRPWLVSVHPTGVGNPIDMRWMGSQALHRELGINVIHPVLPKHGPRRRRGQSRVSFPSPDGVVNLQAFSQAVWDVRRAIVLGPPPGRDRGRSARPVAGWVHRRAPRRHRGRPRLRDRRPAAVRPARAHGAPCLAVPHGRARGRGARPDQQPRVARREPTDLPARVCAPGAA